jgi:hypothetical protein
MRPLHVFLPAGGDIFKHVSGHVAAQSDIMTDMIILPTSDWDVSSRLSEHHVDQSGQVNRASSL